MDKDRSLCGLAAEIAEVKRALILFHARPDADAAGSAFAVSLCTVCFIKSRKNDRKKLPVFRYG